MYDDFSRISNIKLFQYFATKRFAINPDETNTIKFTINNSPQHALKIG
jgi:hypothetical protein